jgi:hypothetical protein
MVQFAGRYYIAIRYQGATGAGQDINYYRVTGNAVENITPAAGIALAGNDARLYDIDGRGNLYYIDNVGGGNNDVVRAVTSNGAHVAARDLDGNNAGGQVDGLIALDDRVLARDNGANAVYSISIDTTPAFVVQNNPGGVAGIALDRCLSLGGGNTIAVDGGGTPVVRCVWDNGGAGGERLSVIAHNGAGTYASNSIQINSTSTAGGAITKDNVRFGANAVLVPTRNGAANPHVINRCTITTTPTLNVSCSTTNIPNPVSPPSIIPLGDTTRIYPFVADPATGAPIPTNLLKFNGNDVFYLMAPTALRVGDIFGTQQTLPIPTPGASGGNASFDLTRFASGFQPVGKLCATQIRYLSSRTADIESYDIAQPSNACLNRILKVY